MSEKNTVGGFEIGTLLQNQPFISKKTQVKHLSFELNDIVEVDGSEIMKLLFFKKYIARFLKFEADDGSPAVTFDMVDIEKKTIVLKSNKTYIGAIGVAEAFYKINFITQWEPALLTKICRGFLFGDTEIFQLMVTKYHLQISRESEWHLRNKLGLK